jgi:hypothetical protein
VASADATAPSLAAPTTELINRNAERHRIVWEGEEKIRNLVGRLAPLKFTQMFRADTRRWEVATQFLPEGKPAILMSIESLDEFPSETLIAQLMLVA